MAQPGISVRIPELNKMIRAMREIGVEAKDLGAASQKAGEITASEIRNLMGPYSRSGKLRKTVKAKRMARKVVVTAGNNTTVKYAGLQNFGSKKTEHVGHRFFEMAIRRTRQQVLDTYLDELQRLVDRAERKAN